MLDGYVTRGDVASRAPLQKWLFEGEACFRESDEQAIVQLQKIRHDAAQDHVLRDALEGGFLICDTIATAGVEQAVIAPRCAGGHSTALDDGDAQAAQREIVCRRCSGRSGTNHNDMRYRRYDRCTTQQ
jgi:hypothetical protein